MVNVTCYPLIYTMNCPRLIVSNKMEEFISIQRVNTLYIWAHQQRNKCGLSLLTSKDRNFNPSRLDIITKIIGGTFNLLSAVSVCQNFHAQSPTLRRPKRKRKMYYHTKLFIATIEQCYIVQKQTFIANNRTMVYRNRFSVATKEKCCREPDIRTQQQNNAIHTQTFRFNGKTMLYRNRHLETTTEKCCKGYFHLCPRMDFLYILHTDNSLYGTMKMYLSN